MLYMLELSVQKLSNLERKILAELDINCRVTSSQIAKNVKKSRQTVDYAIKKLVEKGIISNFIVSFNPHKMGYKLYKVYLKLRNIPEKKEELLTFLRNTGSIFWIGKCSGSWDLIFGVYVKTDFEFFNFKNKLITEFNELIVAEEGKVPIDVYQFPKMYFTNKQSPPVMFAGEIKNYELDKNDVLILNTIINNARLPVTEISLKTNITPRIVASKLKELEKKGIIIQYRIEVDLSKIGLELYKAIIKFDKYSEKEANKLLEYLSKLPNTHYLIRNIWDIEIELAVSNNHEYYKIIENLQAEFPYSIRTIESVLMNTDEWGLGFKKIFN